MDRQRVLFHNRNSAFNVHRGPIGTLATFCGLRIVIGSVRIAVYRDRYCRAHDERPRRNSVTMTAFCGVARMASPSLKCALAHYGGQKKGQRAEEGSGAYLEAWVNLRGRPRLRRVDSSLYWRAVVSTQPASPKGWLRRIAVRSCPSSFSLKG